MSGGGPAVRVAESGVRRRGAPLLLLLAVAGGWSGLRALWWQAPHFMVPHSGGVAARAPAVHRPVRALPPAFPVMEHAAPVMPMLGLPSAPVGRVFVRGDSGHGAVAPWELAGAETQVPAADVALASGPVAGPVATAVAPRADPLPAAAAHQMLWMAAMASLPLPAAFGPTGALREATGRDGAQRDNAVVVRGRAYHRPWAAQPSAAPWRGLRVLDDGKDGQGESDSRWSGDGWAMVRRDGGATGGPSGLGPTYGGNQIGAVVRYRLKAGEAVRLTAYARAYGAMNGTGEREAAAGLSLRPVAGLPVVALAEMRASRFADGTTHARPSASLVTQLPPIPLGKGLAAEAYVQGGYVGGAEATGFIDGQMRVDRLVSRLGGAEVRLGAGAWGGAQRGVERVDIGPSLRVGWNNGRVGARLALDWRVRVGGNAAPSSGPALTLSAGF